MTALPTPLFVYGTLRSGGTHAHLVDPVVVRREPASARGWVRSLEEFPVAAFGAAYDGVVDGELLWLDDDEILDRLDAYEGKHFRRVTISVTTADGADVAAYVYEWTGAAPRP